MLCALATISVVGCSTTKTGEASPAPVSGLDSENQPPPVVDPLNVSPYLEDPCGLVPGAEPARLGYENKRAALPENHSGARLSGPGCDWHAQKNGGTLHVGLQSKNRERGTGGLRGIYQGHFVTKQYSYLEPTTIDGYPAAFSDAADGRPGGSASLFVGIADDMTFSVALGPLGEGKQQEAEEGVRTIASAVIRTLKGGA